MNRKIKLKIELDKDHRSILFQGRGFVVVALVIQIERIEKAVTRRDRNSSIVLGGFGPRSRRA